MRTNASTFGRTLPGVLILVLCGNPAVGAATSDPGADAASAADTWVAEYAVYAAQLSAEQEMYFDPKTGDALGDLIRRLPTPDAWPEVHRALVAAMENAPSEPPALERRRLQAGAWLLARFLGEGSSVFAEIEAAAKAGDSEEAERLKSLSRIAGGFPGGPGGGLATGSTLEEFERKIMMTEPVDLEEVKRVLGGEEKFAILERLLVAGRELREKIAALFAELEESNDEAAVEAKYNALLEEFEAAHGEDQRALLPALESPVLQRYLTSLFSDETSSGYVPRVHVPDLVALAGEEEAEALMNRALRAPVRLLLEPGVGPRMRELVRELVLSNIGELKSPHWGLVASVEDSPVFEALRERFPDVEPGADDYYIAASHYLAGMIQSGRADAAVEFASSLGDAGYPGLPYQIADAMERAGSGEALWNFLHSWLKRHPGSDQWDRFNRLSAELGRQDELKELVAALVADGSVAGIDRQRVETIQTDAELAVEDLGQARDRMLAMLQTPAADPEELRGRLDVALKLIPLAHLMGDEATFVAALAADMAVLEKSWQLSLTETIRAAADLQSALNALGRHAEAYQAGLVALGKLSSREQAGAGGSEDADHMLRGWGFAVRGLLAEQLRAAVELGRWDDAEALLQENPLWGARDVSALLHTTVASDRRPVGYYVARVVLQKGDVELARRILEAQLWAVSDSDAVYEAYLDLAKQEARPLLAKLQAIDRYEERPLIWLARLQGDAGEWDESIETLQQAINIDPSDGEQGRGDRMRVYAHMARAMDAKGDATKAAFFNDVVKSIRLSETADQWYEIGAYARAIRLYREALGFFADAYCIQSRLAVRLADEGRMDEAAEHYRRAFELMPDSFGRVESHCFGCEHVFAGEKSQGVAEGVFLKMLQARPDKPQLHYLMGYLREEQKRHAEAAEHYREAVRLDPLYLNAWKHLGDLADGVSMTADQNDELRLKLIELDPTSRHSYPVLEGVSDFRRLFFALEARAQVLAAVPAPEPMFALTASAAGIDNNTSEIDEPSDIGRGEQDFAEIVLGDSLVSGLQFYLLDLATLQSPDASESVH